MYRSGPSGQAIRLREGPKVARVLGFIFLIGAVLLASATVLWTWRATCGRSALQRVGLLLCALIVLFMAINLTTQFASSVFPGSWLADELGVIAVAVAAIIAGSGVTGAGTIIDRA